MKGPHERGRGGGLGWRFFRRAAHRRHDIYNVGHIAGVDVRWVFRLVHNYRSGTVISRFSWKAISVTQCMTTHTECESPPENSGILSFGYDHLDLGQD